MEKTKYFKISFLSKRTMAILLSGTLVFVPGCQSQYKNKYVAENNLPDEEYLKTSFENTYDCVYQNGKGVIKYYSKYIRLFYDPEVGAKRIYYYYEWEDGKYLYTLPDGELEMIYYLSDFNNHYWDPYYDQYIKEHSVKLSDDELLKYNDEIEEIKDSYEIEELNNLLDLYAIEVDAINETKAEGRQKVK